MSRKVLQESDFAFPTEAQLRAATEADLRAISKATGAPRIATLLQAQRDAKAAIRAGLAKGLDVHCAPHSAKAIQDDRLARQAAAPAKVAKAVRMAKRATTASPKADDQRTIKLLDKAYTFGREGSSRNASWIACTKSKTVADYAAKGGALKYLPRWIAANAIQLGDA